MNLPNILYNRVGRLRSGWRFMTFVSAFVFTSFLAALLTEIVLLQFGTGYGPSGALSIALNGFESFVIAVLLGWQLGKILEDLPFRALGAWFAPHWFKDLIAGSILGALTLIFAAAIAVAFDGLRFNFNQTQEISAILLSLGFSLLIFIVGAAFEEALFRGYILQTFARANLAWLAILLTSLFFAVVHLGNDNATWLSTANTLLAGIWFSVAYLKTRTLWLPFGLHLMWNWFQGAVFGIEVSGITYLTTAPLLKETDAGPVWLTGENYGIEGGIAATAALVVSILLIWVLPIFKPTEEMLILTSKESLFDEEARRRGIDAERF